MENGEEQLDIVKLSIITFAGILILSIAIFAAYKYSQRQSGNIVLPGGVTYLGPSPTPTFSVPPTPTPHLFTSASDTEWKTYKGKIYPYTISYPSALTIVVFPDDPIDSVAIVWDNIPPQQNILLNMEFIDKRDSKLAIQPKVEYVRNWYKFFPGLKGVAKVGPFTNTQGLKGYKATYINLAGATPNLDVFFEIPGNNNHMIHLANGILDPTIFSRIIDSLKWNTK